VGSVPEGPRFAFPLAVMAGSKSLMVCIRLSSFGDRVLFMALLFS
jgi:hypothetical protein